MADEICTLLAWDTQFFGYRIARLNLSQLRPENISDIDNWCQEHEIECLYFLADSADAITTRLAEDNGYRLQDVRMLFDLNLSKMESAQTTLAPEFEQSMASAADTQSLLSFVQNSFIHTRFYYDPHFTKEQCNRLYETWLIRSIEEDFADTVIKLSFEGEAAAFVTCMLNPETATGSISLIGVSERMRGRGLGVSMVQIAIQHFQEKGMEFAEVVTQGRNIAAQRLYQKCGFRTKQTSLWYHKWFR